MKKTRLLLVVTVLALLLCGICHAQSVKVKIAPFYTQIENVSVDNRYVEYPLITYKDITYFPMTHDLCAMLRLSTGFDLNEGLYITKYHASEGGSNLFGGDAVNYYNTEYDATIPTYPVYLNGIKIDNTKEEYPLINFRNITYFPMTWRFAYEELNFDINFSQEDYAFFLERGDRYDMAYAYKADEKTLYLENKISVYEDYISEYGTPGHRLLYSFWKHYEFDLESETIVSVQNNEEGKKYEFDTSFGRVSAEEIEVTTGEDGLYLGKELILSRNTKEISDIQANEYKTGENSSVIRLSVYTGQIMPPYSQHEEYVIARDGNTFTRLDWDAKNNFRGIFSDDMGGFYICSIGYSPFGSARWSNSFSDVYYYKPESKALVSYAEKYEDIINSVEVIGKANGKLYVKAMWYNGDKSMGGDIDFAIAPVNSGFYEINLENGEMSKIYPYIYGETFMTPNGALYCSANYARTQRFVNLVTGKIIPIE